MTKSKEVLCVKTREEAELLIEHVGKQLDIPKEGCESEWLNMAMKDWDNYNSVFKILKGEGHLKDSANVVQCATAVVLQEQILRTYPVGELSFVAAISNMGLRF
jgi:hypothetical protein